MVEHTFLSTHPLDPRCPFLPSPPHDISRLQDYDPNTVPDEEAVTPPQRPPSQPANQSEVASFQTAAHPQTAIPVWPQGPSPVQSVLSPGPGVAIPDGHLLHMGKCDFIPSHVPHRGGLWMFAVSRNPHKNKGCVIKHEAVESSLDIPWKGSNYDISGKENNKKKNKSLDPSFANAAPITIK